MSSSSAGARRPWVFGALGVGLAAVLAVVLFVGVGTGSGTPSIQQQATAANLQPGINAATGLLLSLTVIPASSPKQAPDFSLTDQNGKPVSMRALRGKVVVFSPNDDQCEDLCTLLANDIVLANQDLGRAANDVVWLSVNANPFYPSVSAVRAWTDQHGLGTLSNWQFATADPATLAHVWSDYGFLVQQDASTRTVEHSTELYFIDPSGKERAVAQFGTAAANTSLYAHGIAQMADDLLPPAARVQVAGPETTAPAGANAAVDATTPDFTLPLLQGPGTLRLSSRRGRPTVVNFWSSTCTACREELPHIEAAYRYAGTQVSFVGVDVTDEAGPARAMAAAAGLTYPLVSDRDGTAAGGEQISGLPFTVILDASGRVVVRHPGDLTTEQLDYLLQNLVPGLPPTDD